MGRCSGDVSPGTIREQVEAERAASATDPVGVIYLDQLWELIRGEAPLQVVLQTSDQTFPDVPVSVFSRQYHYDREGADAVQHELWLDLPDEVCRQIQQAYAGAVHHALYGERIAALLPRAFRPEDKRLPLHQREGLTVVEANNWSAFREVIRLCSTGPDDYLRVHPYTEHVARARVSDGQLLLTLDPRTVASIVREWQNAHLRFLGYNVSD